MGENGDWMIKLRDTEFEQRVPTKYFEGRVVEKKYTQMGHLFITCDEVCKVTATNNVIDRSEVFDNTMNFLIPKRRRAIFVEADTNLGYKKKYIFKLQEESRSKKFVVSEIFTTVEVSVNGEQ